MKKGMATKVFLSSWAVSFAVAFLLDIAPKPVEFPGVRAVMLDALGTLAFALVVTGAVWLYYRAVGKRDIA